MTSADQPPQKSSAWNWPAEWAVERTFWREVGTRTVAGVLTIVILAVPGLIYAAIFGLLTLGQVIQILIGIGVFALILAVYIVVLRMIRRRESKKIARALAEDKSQSGAIPTPEQLMGYSEELRAQIMSKLSRITQDDISQAERRARHLSMWTTVVGLLLGILSSLLPLWFR
ncbi:hypothetical protein [Paenarthrobacter sp. YIM B13468]|uniref:hypothetical protein n=1 Tax=Paenarthrobacter sp. YIM B13468 TaxID=3366295 RepID=UPI00366AED10